MKVALSNYEALEQIGLRWFMPGELVPGFTSCQNGPPDSRITPNAFSLEGRTSSRAWIAS